MRQNVLHSWFTEGRRIVRGLPVGAAVLILFAAGIFTAGIFAAGIASTGADAQVRNSDQPPAIAVPRQDTSRPGLSGATRPQDNARPGYRPGAFVRGSEPRSCAGFRSDERRPGAARQECR